MTQKEALLRVLSALRPLPARERGLPETLTGAASLGDIDLMRIFLERGADVIDNFIRRERFA